MTVQLVSANAYGKSKATLQAALTAHPSLVWFDDPSPWGSRSFTGADIKPGDRFLVVMDPKTRMRFAEVERRSDGSFKVH